MLAVRQELIEAHPWLPRVHMEIWDDAKNQSRDFHEDPGYAYIAFARNEFEAQESAMGHDAWPSGAETFQRKAQCFHDLPGQIALRWERLPGRSGCPGGLAMACSASISATTRA